MHLPSLLGHVQELLGIILQSDKPADSLIDSFFRARKYLGSHDRRFIAESTYGTLRHLRRAQVALPPVFSSIGHTPSPEDVLLLTVVSYLIGVEKKSDVTEDAVGQKLQSPLLKEKLSYILGQLAKANHLPEQDDITRLGVQYSFPDWMVRTFIEQFGATEAESLCRSLNEQAPITLRVNTLKTNVDDCQGALQKKGVETTRTKLSPLGLNVSKRFNVFSLEIFQEGFFEVQDEGSQLLPLLIDPKPTAKLLDACAGAGGKTLELSAIMKNRGEIFAADVNEFRLKELHKRAKRADVSNVRIKKIDGLEDLAADYTGNFDIVLVDAPCSGLGTIRRNPGMKWKVTEETVRELSQKQSHILESCANLVKPGGKLVYATCTLLREENEDVIERFLSSHVDFTPLDPAQRASTLNLTDAISGNFIKLLPHRQGTDGFFFATMQKAKPKPTFGESTSPVIA
jgi:16S rRNA (cytosine967-C5)-methyltransferase